ncbi:elongation factor P--(R)-beta-lysine ligase [Thalassotalea crassostreae]|uniref:elongation factor P--(R)-beta-lysine ligase n=1 Tax=Thalassotalea crassostreae TaxID=1763536 RepID=UPI0008385FF3|nr:elongation factor P--(R)-beta-lysine ligase [Thalassotalea crassostreae]
MNWQPSASIENLRHRADILAKIRTFFTAKNVLEVDTQALSHATVTDLHLVSFETRFIDTGANQESAQTLYLQTSPEFAMKRLLAANSGCIYQICKAFRNEESGRHHNPEFTMLEWYRVGFNHFDLMNEVAELILLVLDCEQPLQKTYQQVFIEHVGVDPLEATIEQLKAVTIEHRLNADWIQREDNKDTILQFLFAELVESKIANDAPCFVYNYPSTQAALAKISASDNRVAERFELFYRGIELANGFNELTDSAEQECRFNADNKLRKRYQLTEKPVDKNLISALSFGLPDCAGVALGIDRLVMLALNASNIDDVIAFPINKA